MIHEHDNELGYRMRAWLIFQALGASRYLLQHSVWSPATKIPSRAAYIPIWTRTSSALTAPSGSRGPWWLTEPSRHDKECRG